VPDWLYLILTVPALSAFIGWVTNWQAVKMIFWPAVKRFGWQGIVYAHADKFATNLGRIAQNDLMNGAEMASRFDPAEMEQALAPVLEAETPALVADAAELVRPGSWAMVPPPMQAMIVEQIKARTRTIARELTLELRPRVAASIDVQQLVAGQLSGPNVERLARLTEQIGSKEFKFIEYSGGIFGAIIGCGQLVVWSTMNTWWMMPIFGVIVGLVTNYLAIQMIFRPHQKTRYLGFLPYQGLFPKRQAEIARDYGETTAREVITPTNIIDMLVSGERGQQLLAELTELLTKRLEAEWAQAKAMVPLPITDDQLVQVKELVTRRLIELAPRVRPQVEAVLEKQLDIRNTVETRLAALSKPEFERLLRGVFQEDELTLIVVGGVLGGAVGALQGALVLAGVG